MNKIEKIAYILIHIEESIRFVDIEESKEEINFNPKEMDWDFFKPYKKQWENGIHNGDCVDAPCSCSACQYSSVLEESNSMAIILEHCSNRDLDYKTTILRNWFIWWFFIGEPPYNPRKLTTQTINLKEKDKTEAVFETIADWFKEKLESDITV